jgi:hypothetical protein
VLILGANGDIARVATDLFLNETDARLTLYLRNARRLAHRASDRVRVVEGVVRLATAPGLEVRKSLGVSKPA